MDWFSFVCGSGAAVALMWSLEVGWAAIGRLIGAQEIDKEFRRLTAENDKLRHCIDDRQRWLREAEEYMSSAARYLKEVERVAAGDVVLEGERAALKN